MLVLESFGEQFPAVYMDAGKKGWFVSTLLLGAWLGSLINGPFANRIGRRYNIIVNVVIFLLGSALQTAAMNEAYLFVGRFIAGVSVGALTHVVPMYIAEISSPNIRGSLVALQQLAITLGILVCLHPTLHILTSSSLTGSRMAHRTSAVLVARPIFLTQALCLTESPHSTPTLMYPWEAAALVRPVQRGVSPSVFKLPPLL